MTSIMGLPQMSIRRMLVLITGALTLLTATLAGVEFAEKARTLSDMSHLRRTTELTSQFFSAIEEVTIERDLALSLLNSRDPAGNELLRARLVASRRDARVGLRAALAALEKERQDGMAPLIERIRTRTEAIEALRAEIDAALALPLRNRDRSLSARWSGAVADLMQDADTLWFYYVRPYVNIDAVVTQNLRLSNLLRIIVDYSGRERALIGQILAARENARPEDAAELFRGDGVLQSSWSASLDLAQQSGIYPEIASHYLDARSHYEMLRGMIQDAFYTPGARGQDMFPLGPAMWLELSEQAQESLNALRGVTREAMLARVDALTAQTKNAMVMQAAILIAALLLCALSFWVIFQRIINPIRDIIDALEGAAKGERAAFPAGARTNDEIGQLVGVLHAFQDAVDGVRRTAKELDRNERRLRAVMDNAVDGLITIDAKGVIETFNPASERIFGYNAHEVIGRNISVLMPEPQRSEHDTYLANYAGTGEVRAIGAAGRELLAQRKNGSVFPIDLSVCGLRLPEGDHFAGFIRDITQRKQAEQAITDYTHALERSNKELDDFAYIASHDLKEPLRGIHNHSRFLLEDNAEKLDEESVNRLGRLLYLSQRMERLVNDLLYFSRLGRQELAVQPTDLGEVITDIAGTLEHFLGENCARISVPRPLPRITCDRTRVAEAFRNLITNGVKYNESAEKVIEVGVTEKRTPSGALSKRVFYVADNGCGIPAEFHQDVFRIFKRLQNRTSEKDGTGVGLTFVKKIVERHGGEIWVESEPGKGSTFLFTLETPDNASSSIRRAA